MKCDELQERWFEAYPVEGDQIIPTKVYGKKDADEAIAELKAEINKYQELLYGQTEYHSVLAMCSVYGCKDVREFHDTINVAIDRSSSQINYQKHKRCLLRSVIAEMNAVHFNSLWHNALVVCSGASCTTYTEWTFINENAGVLEVWAGGRLQRFSNGTWHYE